MMRCFVMAIFLCLSMPVGALATDSGCRKPASAKKAKRKKRKRKKRRKAKAKARPAKEVPAPPKAAAEPVKKSGGPSLQRSNRIEFDARLVRGEKASGAVYLFQRAPRRFPSLVDLRRRYLERITEPVLGPPPEAEEK